MSFARLPSEGCAACVKHRTRPSPGTPEPSGLLAGLYEELRDLYGTLGYFQWTGSTQRNPDPQFRANLVIKLCIESSLFGLECQCR